MAGDLGLSGAFGVAALQQSVRQRILDQLKRQQEGFNNDLALRESDRADRALAQKDTEFNLRLKELADAKEQQDANQQFTIGTALNNSIPADTVIPTTSPAVRPLQTVGALQHQDATLPSTSTVGMMDHGPTPGMQLRGRLISQATSAGNPEQYRKLASATQAEQARDNVRADASVPLEKVGPQGILTPRAQAIGKQAYQAPPTPQLAIVQTTNEQGQNVTKIVPKVAGSEFVGKQDTATVAADRSKKEALDTLGQLDQAIDAASGLIGPGEGRVSNVEQMIGSADPRIQALGVKMKAAKMQADHAITGSVRAGASPTLIKQWDDILANKVTPEGLHASVKALREIITGSGTPKGGKLSAEELIKKYGGP